MSKWRCKCGYNMNDHDAPNKHGFLVYSEYDWDKAIDTCDYEGKIHWQDFPDPTYDVYKCPGCGRLMVFNKFDQYEFYQLEK